MATEVIFFDLDRCIFDTSTLGKGVLRRVAAPLLRADISEAQRVQMRELLLTTGLDDAAAAVGLPDSVRLEMRETYRTLTVSQSANTYGDEHCLRELPTVNILVTTGYRKFQMEKIAMLGISDLFSEIIVDALDDPELRKGKQQIFGELLERHGWTAAEVLVVGDNPRSELDAGKVLGIRTVQTLRPGVVRWEKADHHVTSLCEIAALLG